MATAHGICKKCGKEAVHLAMSGLITFYGDQDDDLDGESIYADELITPDDVSVGIHVCYKCGHVEDVWVEHPHENETIADLRAENDRLGELVEKYMSGLEQAADDLQAENARLRQILVDVCNATRGGCTDDVSVDFLAHLPGELAAMTKKVARLDQALADTAAQLVQAVERAQEAEYNLHLMTKQADANYKRAKGAEEQLRKYQIVTLARRCKSAEPCDGDGSGPGCENPVDWEIEAMDGCESHYAYVCADHLSDYQKWAADDGRLPMVFELEDDNG